MKILFTEFNTAGQKAILPIGDNVLLRNNDEFYVPEFTTRISCAPQLVVRISRLGRSIAERFAKRYYEEIGMGIRFYADDYSDHLASQKLPKIMASAFDGSAAISSLTAKEERLEYEFKINGRSVFSRKELMIFNEIDLLIAEASRFHTLKIGDYLYCGNHLFPRQEAKRGDRLQICCNDKEMMNFKIK